MRNALQAALIAWGIWGFLVALRLEVPSSVLSCLGLITVAFTGLWIAHLSFRRGKSR
jgi:hypothetical protein